MNENETISPEVKRNTGLASDQLEQKADSPKAPTKSTPPKARQSSVSSQSPERIIIPIKPRTIGIWLFSGIITLVTMHVAMMILHRHFDHRYTETLFEMFALDNEGNLPAYFSAGILGISAALFWTVAKASASKPDPQTKWWYGLFLCFMYLSLDEAVQIHERFDSNSLLSFMNTSGLLAWAWVIPYGIIAIAFGVIYFRFWLSLPTKYRILFGLCGGFYVMGAIGFEMLGAREYDVNQKFTTLYDVIYTTEETIEMSSIAALIVVLLSYISSQFKTVRFSGERSKGSASI